MLKVYGKVGCSRCEIVKTALNMKKKEFEYKVIDNMKLTKEEEEIIGRAMSEGFGNFPIIIEDDKFMTPQEVMR